MASDRCTSVKYLGGQHIPLYSRKLHIRVRRARTSCVTSLTILALSFGESVVNHLARRCVEMSREHATLPSCTVHTTLPCLDRRIK